MLLICGSFAEIFANYKTIWASLLQVLSPFFSSFRHDKNKEEHLIQDPAPKDEQVPFWMYGGGIFVSIVFTCIILGFQYKQNVSITLLSILFAFIFSFITAESCGRTGLIPVATVGTTLLPLSILSSHFADITC
jgi:OPT oligopeptide transporter protein